MAYTYKRKENFKIAELRKFRASEILAHIKHDLREIPIGKEYGNEDIDTSLTHENYSLLEGRCRSASESNRYRKGLEKELFKYNRKNLIHAVEICVQCPTDCPAEQKDDFFNETFNYICNQLPMGKRCVFVAQIHKDERKYDHAGNLISKDHLHLMYVPAVKDLKHDGFEYRLCADQLTKKARLREFHPGLQKHLDQAGINATVYRKKESDGQAIPLSVKQLKTITNQTGITIDHTLTVDELSQIINSNILHKKQLTAVREELLKKDQELDQIKIQNEELKHRISGLENSLKTKEQKTHVWGNENAWGNKSGWNIKTSQIEHAKEEEKLW